MKTKSLTIILISLTTIFLIASVLLFVNRISLNKEIEKGELKIVELTDDKTALLNEKENLQTKISDLELKYDLLKQDVAKIYKTCLTENACKGHYPGVSWYCNNVGDEVSDYSHICVCDSACNLNATEAS